MLWNYKSGFIFFPFVYFYVLKNSVWVFFKCVTPTQRIPVVIPLIGFLSLQIGPAAFPARLPKIPLFPSRLGNIHSSISILEEYYTFLFSLFLFPFSCPNFCLAGYAFPSLQAFGLEIL